MGNYVPTIVFDFDGTICTTVPDRQYHLIQPKYEVINKLNRLYDIGYRIVIFTGRGMITYDGDLKKIEERYRQEIEDFLAKHKVKYHQLLFGKPSADMYVDDKGINVNDFIL